MILSYIYTSKTGLKRSVNEDFANVFELDDGLLCVVCDGLGGNVAGDTASKLAVSTIENYFRINTHEEHLTRLNNAILKANEQIVKAGKSDSQYKGMATTAVVLFIHENKACWGHVGDSRIYLAKHDSMIQLTKDHSLVQKLVDNGYITEREAEQHPQRNIIVRALGDKQDVIVDFDYFYLDENESWKFLLCTDGVSGVVDKEELYSYLRNENLNEISTLLTKEIEERGAPDNFTFIIVANKNSLNK